MARDPVRRAAEQRAYSARPEVKQRKHAYYMAHREEIIARSSAWAKANPEKIRSKRARSKSAPYSDKIKQRQHAYYMAHREEMYLKARSYRAKNPEAVRAWGARYRAKNPEAVRATRARYSAKNLERRAAYQRAVVYVAGEQVNFNTLPPELREVAVLLKQTRKAIRGNKRGSAA